MKSRRVPDCGAGNRKSPTAVSVEPVTWYCKHTQCSPCSLAGSQKGMEWKKDTEGSTDLHIYIPDAVPPVHVISNHVDTDKLTTADGGTSTSNSARLSSQPR